MRQYYKLYIIALVALNYTTSVKAQCPPSTPNFSSSANNVCAQTPITFTISSPNAGEVYTWNFGDPASGTSNTAQGISVTHSFSPNASGATYTVTAYSTPRAEDVVWQNIDSDLTVLNGNSMIKTSGGNSWNAGAGSTQNITDNMYVEFTAGEPSSYLACGIGTGGNNPNINTIEYAIRLRNNGTAQVRENNTAFGPTVNYSEGDTFRVAFENSVINYYQNGSVFYTSTKTPNLSNTHYADFSIRNQGDTLHNPIIGYTCMDSATTNITTLATPNFTVTGSFERCIAIDPLGYFNASFFVSVPGTYTFDFGDGSAPFTQNIPSTSLPIVHTYNSQGVFPLTVTQNNGTCTGTFMQDVVYLERPSADMVLANTDICEGDTIWAANNTDTTNIDFFVWDWGDGSTLDTFYTADSAYHIYNFSDVEACQITQGGVQYDVTLYAYNRCFQHTNASPITVTARPRLNATAPQIVCEFENNANGVNFNTAVCPPPTDPNDPFSDLNSYVWSFDDPASGIFDTSYVASPTHYFTSPGDYLVRLTVIASCGSFQDSFAVRIVEDPNALATFTVNNPPSSNINGDGCRPLEATFQNNSTGGDSLWYNWNITSNVVGGMQFINGTSDTSTNPVILFSEPGSYYISMSATNICTTSTWLDTIVVLDGPSVTLNPVNPSCDTFFYVPDVTYDQGGGAITSYNWTFINDYLGSPTTTTSTDSMPAAVMFTGAGPHRVIIQIQNDCTLDADTIQFNIPLTPTPVVINGGNASTCITSPTFNFTATPNGGTWSGNGITNTSTGAFNPALAGLGTHTITYVYDIGNGCPATVETTVIVNDLPTISAGGQQTICENDPPLTITGGSPVGGFWTGFGVTDSMGIFDPSVTGSGLFPVMYHYQDANGCEDSTSKNIRVYALPAINLGSNLPQYCIGSTVNLTAAPAGGTWSGTGITDPNAGTFNTNVGLGFYTVTYTYTDANSCTTQDSIQIEVITGTPVTAGSDTTLCINGNQFDLVSGTPSGGYWDGVGVVNTGSFNYAFFPSIAGIGTHTVRYIRGSGSCEARDSIVITVIDIPTVDAGADTTVCIGSPTFNLTGTPLGGTWSGTGITDANAGTFDPNMAANTYLVTYTYTDPVTLCQNSDTRAVNIVPLPTVATTDVTECDNPDNYTITGYSPNTGGVWTGAGIVDANNGIFNANTAGNLANDGSDTTYLLTFTFTDANGCIDSSIMNMTLTFGDTVVAGPDDTLCINNGVYALTASPSGGTWNGNGVAGTNFYPSAAGTGTHILLYTYGTGTCEKTDTTIILVRNIPTVEAGPNEAVCVESGALTLTGFSPLGGVWSGNGIIDTTGIFHPDSAGTGLHILTYTYTDPITGCFNSDTKSVTVSALPVVTVPSTVAYCDINENINLTNYSPAGGIWTGNGIVDSINGVFNPNTAGGLGSYLLTYTYTDGNNCSNFDTLRANVITGDTVIAGPGDTVCQYDPIFNLTGFTPAGGTWSGTGIVDANAGTYNPGIVNPGTYQLIYTFGSGSCEKADTTYVVVGATPVVNAGNNVAVCADDTAFTLTGFTPSSGGIWSGTGITDSLNGVFDPQVSGTGTFTLLLTYTDTLYGCLNTDTRDVTVNPLPVITMTDTLLLCNSGTNEIITGYSPTGGTWSGLGIVDANSGVFNSAVAGGVGTYPVIYEYTDNNGCTNTDTMVIEIIFGDSIEAGPDLAVCISDAAFALTGYTPSSGGTWSGTGITDANAGIFDPSSAGVGSWTITYTHGTSTCLKSDTRTILVGGIPTVIAGNDQTFCLTEPADTLTGYSPANGIWSGNGIINDTLGVFHPDSAGVGSHTITYTFTNTTTGCVNSDTKTMTVNPLPTITVPDTVTYCDNPGNITLSGYAPLGGTWSGNGIIDPANGIFNTIVAGGVGTYEVTYTVTNGSNCIDSAHVILNIIFGDTVEAGPQHGVCIDNGSYTLTGYSPAGGIWSGPGITDAANGIFDPTAVSSNVLHTLYYTYGSGTCEKTDSTTIFVGTIPPVEAGQNQTVCEQEPSFTLTGFVPSNGGTWTGVGIIDDTLGIFDPAVAGAGTHTLTYTFTNSFTGCSNFDTKTIRVLPAPTVSAGSDRTECNNAANITLNGYSPLGGIWSGPGIIDAQNGIFNSIIAGGVGVYNLAYTYTDSIGCSNADTMQFTVIFGDTVEAGPNQNVCINSGFVNLVGSPAGGTWAGNGIIDPNGTFDPATAGTGSHTLTYTYGTGTCQKTDQMDIFVSPAISVNAGPDETVCAADTAFSLTGMSPSGGYFTGNGIIDSSGIFDPAVAGTGFHVVTYFYTNTVTSCEGSDTRTIEVLPPPVVDAGPAVTYCNTPNNITLTGYSPNGGTWAGAGIIDPINGIFNAQAAGGIGNYQLVYSYTTGGCTDQDTLDVMVIFGDTVYAGVDDTVCIDDAPFTLTGNSPGGGFWSGNGITDPINGVFDPSVAGAGFHTLTYTQGTGSCQKTDDKVILVGSLPIINPGPNEVVCISNGAFNLSGFSPQGGTWAGPGITNAVNGTFDPSVVGLGTYTLTYTFVDATTGCSNDANKVVQVVPLPTVITLDTVEYCNTVNDIALTGYSPSGGTWSGPGIVDASNGIFNTIIAGGIGQYSLVYTYQNGNNCEDSDTMIVNVVFGDTVVAGPDQSMCIDDGLVIMQGFSPFGGTWSGTGIIDPSTGTFDPQVAGAGLHTLTYTYGSGSCQKSDDKTVFVGTPPAVTAGPDVDVCQTEPPFQLNNASPSGGTYSGPGITNPNGTFDPSIVGVGNYNVVYTYINSVTGCQNEDTLVVNVIAPPAVDAGPQTTYCVTNQNITLTGYTPAGGLWNGPGVVDGINGIFNTQVADGVGTYKLAYTFTNSSGCTSQDTLEIIVIAGDTVEAGPNDTICIDNGVFVLSGYSPQLGIWSGTGIIDSALGIFDPSVSGTGTHTLTYTYGAGTCRRSDTKTIFVDGLPIINPGPDETICINNGAYSLSGYTPQGGTWSGNGIIDATNGVFDPVAAGLGTHTISYTFVNNITNCSTTETKIISVVPLPQITAGDTALYCNTPNQITLSNYSPTGGTWSGNGIVDAQNGIFSTVLAGGIGQHELYYSFTNSNGCTSMDTLIVDIIYGDTVQAGTNESICIDNGLYTITGFSPTGGTWSGTGIVDPAGIFDPAAAGVGTHTLTYTFGTGTCQKTSNKTITVGALPNISAGVDETVCIDAGIIQMSGYSPIGGTWSGVGITDPNAGLFDPSIGIGNYTLTYTFTNNVTGCTVTDNKVVTVAPLPTVTTQDTVFYCNIPNNITLSGYSPAGGIWSGPGIVDANAGVFNTTQAGGLGTYTLTYNYTDGNGCTNSNTMTVEVIYGDTVVAGTAQAVCIDQGLVQLTGFSPAGGTWSGNGIIDPVVGVFDPQVAGLGNHVLTYTFGSGTCQKNVSKTIFVGDLPIVEAGPNEIHCIDQGAYQLQQFSPVGGVWSGVGITDSLNGIFDPVAAGPGTFTIRYTFTNNITGCENFDTKTITINPLPNVTGPDTLEYCNTNTNIALSGYSPLGGTWSGTGIVDGTNGIFNTAIAGGVGSYTITYDYTDVNGCESNTTTIINVIFGDTVEAGPDFAMCIDDLVQILSGFSPSGGTWSGDGIIDPAGVFDPQVAGGGQHVLTYTYGTGTCQKTDTRTVFVGTIPAVIAGPDEAICQEELAYTLSGFSPPSGVWTGVGITDPAGTFDPQVAGVGMWTLTYTYTNPITGCENFDTKVIDVQPPPAVDAGGTVTYCNTTNNLTLTNYTPSGGTWNGAGIVDGINGIFNPQSAGGLAANGSDTTYQVVYSFTNPAGCFNRDTLDIIVTFGDTVYAGTPDTVCIDDGQYTLTGYTPPAGGMWSGNGIVEPTLGVFDPAVAGVGIHTLTYTFGTGSCEKSSTKTVFVGALPVINPGNDQTVCISDNAFNLTNFSPQGGTWIGVGITDPVGVFDPAVAGVGTWTLTYTFTNSITGCDNTATKTITVAPLPIVTAGDSVEYCNTSSDITLTNYSPSGGTWSGPGIVSSNSGIFNTNLAGGLGTYELTYTITDNNGCTNRDTLEVSVVFGDTVYAGSNMNVCIDDGLITLAGYTPPSGGMWTGNGIVDGANGIFDPVLAGSGTHVLTYTFGNGTCEKTSTRTIFVGTIPVVDAGPDLTVCEDQALFQLGGNSPIGGTWVGTGITDSVNGLFDPQVAGVGNYTITYTFVNSLTGCENFDTVNIDIVPLPTVVVDDSVEFCINNNNIDLNNFIAVNPPGGAWSGPGVVDPANGLFNATIAGGIGTYNLTYTYSDNNNCDNSDVLLVNVVFGDTVEAGPRDTLCLDDNPLVLTGFSPSGGVWTGPGVDQASATFDPQVAGVGQHTLTYTYGSGTCEKSDTKIILVGAPPTINIGNDQTVCIDDAPFTISGYSPQGGTWAGVGITDPNVGIFSPQAAGIGTHILTYTFVNSITGCDNAAQRTITVAPLPVVFAGDTAQYCDSPNDITLMGYTPPGGTWSGPGVVNPSQGVFNSVIAGGIGVYHLVYAFTDGNGCENSDTLVVDIIFGDSIEAGPNEALCIDAGIITLTGFLPAGGQWSGPGIIDPSGIFDPQVAGPGAHSITITTGSGTCEKTDSKIIFVGTPPIVNPGSNDAVCEGDSAYALTGYSPPGGIWSGTGITDSINGIFDPIVAGVGTHVILYTVTNAVTNCETAVTKQVVVNPLPFVDAGDTVTYCNNPSNITLSNYTPSNGGLWSGPGIINPSNGIFNTGNAGGLGQGGADTSYLLTLTYTDNNGCTNEDDLLVEVIFGDTVVAGPNDTVCIDDLPFLLGGSPNGGTWSGAGVLNGGIFNPSVAGSGTHVLTYTYGTGTCEKTDTREIFVGLPVPVNAGPDYIACVSDTVLILGGYTPAGGMWSGTGIIDPIAGVFNPSQAGVNTHQLTYTYTDPTTGCVSFDTINVAVVPLPVVSAGGTVTYCDWAFDITLTGYSPSGGTWSGPGVVNPITGTWNSGLAGGLGVNGADTTYYLTYTYVDANSCENSDILTINLIYGDTVNAGPDRITCIDDDTLTLGGFSPIGGTWAGMGIIDPIGLFLPSQAGAGTHQLIYTQGSGTCVKSDTILVTVIDVTGTTAGPDEEFCLEDGLVTLSGQSPTGGVWSGPGIQDPNLGTLVTQAIGIDTVTISYTYTDPASNCQYTDFKQVIINPLPIVDFTMVDTACVGDIVQFTNLSTNAINYYWTFGDGDTSVFLDPTHVFDTIGIYPVTLVAFSDNGCPDTLTRSIVIYDIPHAEYSMSADTGCGPLNVLFTNLSTGNEATYLWDFGNGQTSTQVSPGVVTFQPGVFDTTYYITLTVENRCGIVTFSDSVTVFPSPNVIFAPNVAQGCTPLDVSFSNATTGNATSYLWNFGDGTTSTDSIPPVHTFYTINDTTTYYTVTLTAFNHCGFDVDSVTITVEPGSIQAGFNASTVAGCQPLTVDFTSITQPGDNVSWFFGYNGEVSAQLNPTHIFDTAGTFTVYQYVNNSCGFDTSTIQITVFPAPELEFNHDAFVCAGQDIQFFNTSDSIAGNVWYFGDGDSSTLINPLHTYSTPGFYTVILTNYSMTNLCPRSDTSIVEVKANPNASFAPDNLSGCAPLTVNFTNTSTGPFSAWDFGDSIGFSINPNPTYTFADAGQYSVTLRTTDNFGCFTDTTVNGFVAFPKPNADFEPDVEQQCGLDATVTLNNLTTDADAYLWNFGNGLFSTLPSPTISYNNVGDHTITLVSSNTFGCADTVSEVFTTYPGVIADLQIEPQTGCSPLYVQFLPLSLNTTDHIWYFGDGDSSTFQAPIHLYEDEGYYDVTYIASQSNVCFDTLSIPNAIYVQPTPTASFTAVEPDPNNPTGVLQMVNSSTNATSYFWDFGDGATSTLPNPRHEYLENGVRTIQLIAFGDNGCSDTAIVVIEPPFFKGLFVPNAFSPDAGIGDVRVWRPIGVGIAEYRAEVYTPWGELLWSSEALDDAGRPVESWDGRNPNGDQMPQGAYVWKIFAVFEDGSQWEGQKNTLGQTRKVGSVTLLR